MSSMSNKYWYAKADMEVANFVNDGGYLNDEQTSALFEIPIRQSTLLKLITVKPMKASRLEVSKLGFTGRVLRGAVENQALTEAERSKPDAGKTVLDVEEFIAEARVPYGALEDHVTQGTLMTHVRTLLGKAIGRDMEFVSINGDTTETGVTAEALLKKKLNGFIKQTTTNTIAAGTVRLTKGLLKQMRQTLPSEFKAAASQMAYLTSDNAVLDYADSLANRATVLGDQKIKDVTNVEFGGAPVIGVPEFPEELGSGTDETVVLYAQLKNACIGLQRQLMIETEKDIKARQWIVVTTVKFDAKWIHEPATVKATGVLSDAAA
jgi:hypothetical protein